MSDDWLNEGQAEKEEARRAAELDHAKLYVATFVQTDSGRKLLAHWEQFYLKARLQPNSTHADYVWAESRRSFIAGILDQINLVKQNGP
jgi:hypothetical protein